jgi:predicted lysophospholipase L1 biosynthesis ABC-type transport system permease subunit
VGVAADVRYSTALEDPQPLVYFSVYQQSHPRMTLAVRTASGLGRISPLLGRAASSAHPDISVIEMASGRDAQRAHLFLHRMQAEVATLFGALGLAVAALGLFGLLSYTVTLRARELAIRGAVGALPRDIVRLVVGQGMTLSAVGLGAGLVSGLLLTRTLRKLLYGVAPNDPATFLAVAAGLTAVALLATYLPARRAAQGDPLEVLRER